jgi:hypothetical protein
MTTLTQLMGAIGLDTKEHVKAKIAAAVAPLEARIKALEERPAGLKFVGAWEPDVTYEQGDCAQRKGHLWICMQQTTADEPGTSAAWRLAVRAGRDGRDYR